jgi:hypothetical protein
MSQICSAQKEKENFTQLRTAGMGTKLHVVGDLKGGRDGKFYQILISSPLSKKELVATTIAMMEEFGLIDSASVNIDELDDNATKFSFPAYIRQGVGIHPIGSEPIQLHYTLDFEFGDVGVKLSLGNFSEEFFLVHYKVADPLRDKGTETFQKYQEYVSAAKETADATSGFGKFIAKVDKIQEINHIQGSIGSIGKVLKNTVKEKLNEADAQRLNILANYRENVDEQYKLFDEMVKAGEARWYTLDGDTIEYEDGQKIYPYIKDFKEKYPFKGRGADYMQNLFQTAADNSILYSVTSSRWNRDIRYIFDGLFITLTEEVKGSILGIVEDGKQTWTKEGDLVVPTDEKKKAKYIKKGKSFTDYESYDD